MCYIANVGDSRAVRSQNQGSEVINLSIDHKPDNPSEEKRILYNGGKVYRYKHY
jgi:serine/threonine protein phosphatase PrpC